METGLRKRAVVTSSDCRSNGNVEPESANDNNSNMSNVDEKKRQDDNEGSRNKLVWFLVGSVILMHLVALSMFVMGFVLRIQLHTGEECSMTYSHRIFLPINYNRGQNRKTTITLLQLRPS